MIERGGSGAASALRRVLALVAAATVLAAACGGQPAGRTPGTGTGTARTGGTATATGSAAGAQPAGSTAGTSTGTGTATTSGTASTPGAGEDSSPAASISAATPAHGAGGAPLPLRFVVGLTHGGVGWSLLLPGTPSTDRELTELARLLAAAQPLAPPPAGSPPLTCGPSGVKLTPGSPAGPRWDVGLATGSTVVIEPNVMPCGATSITNSTDEYASLNGRPAKAVNLIPRLLAISQALPLTTPLALEPAAPAPGGSVQLTGGGWVGGPVAVSVFWCHRLGASDCTVRPLATLTPDAGGHIAWRGPLPADMPRPGGAYGVGIEAKNALLDYVDNFR